MKFIFPLVTGPIGIVFELVIIILTILSRIPRQGRAHS